MKLVEAYLKKPHLVLSLLLLGVSLGVLSFKALPLNLFPDASYPTVLVVIQYPGATAEDVESQVTIPLEKELATLSLVRRIKSVSRDGSSVISVEFEYEKDLAVAQLEVSAAVDKVRYLLPKEVLPPQIFRISDATTPAMTVAVYPKEGVLLSLSEVRRIVEEYIKPELLRLPEVADVEVFGGYETEVVVELDRKKLVRYGLTPKAIASAIAAYNRNLPSGLIRTTERELFLKFPLNEERPELLLKTPISVKGGVIRLEDVATVRVSYADRTSLFHGNGRPAIALNILRPETGNVLRTIEASKKKLEEVFSKRPRLRYEVVDTQEDVIRTSISNLVEALRDAVILTVSVIFLFLARLRATLLTAVSIPVTYFLTFALMKLFGLELNLVTMTAVILAVGLLVDDSIVVAENIERHIKELGKNPREAAVTGTQEIMLADLSGTVTTILVLIPIMFVGGYVEKILKELAAVLVMALSSSYFVSITVIPLLAPYLLGREKRNALERLVERTTNFVLEFLKGFYLSAFRIAYRYRVLSVGAAFALLAASVKLVMPLVGKDLMPPMDTGILKVSFELTPNTSMDRTERIVSTMEELIREEGGVVRMATLMGTEPGVVSFGTDRTPYQGMITVHFVDRFHRKSTIWEIKERLTEKLSLVPGIKSLSLFEYGATSISSIAAPVDITLTGRDPEKLLEAARRIEERLYFVKGLTSFHHTWDFDRLEYHLIPVSDRLALYGTNPARVAAFLTELFSGRVGSFWLIPEETPHSVRVRLALDQRDSVEELLNSYIPTASGYIPLRRLVEVRPALSRSLITRTDLSPALDILAYRNKAPISHLQEAIEEEISKLDLPEGVRLSHTGEVKHMKEAFVRLKTALVVSLILLYFSLVATFRSFRHPVTIMIAIPLSLIGAIWALLVADKHFCMPASMGMILLSGVVVNNSILLIDFAERARARGRELKEAVEEAIKTRTRPILMTAISTVVGMIPIAAEMAVGLERLSPLAVVAIGGLLVGTLLTLVYIPVFYITFRLK